jgi:hypothetical protein
MPTKNSSIYSAIGNNYLLFLVFPTVFPTDDSNKPSNSVREIESLPLTENLCPLTSPWLDKAFETA